MKELRGYRGVISVSGSGATGQVGPGCILPENLHTTKENGVEMPSYFIYCEVSCKLAQPRRMWCPQALAGVVFPVSARGAYVQVRPSSLLITAQLHKLRDVQLVSAGAS